MTLKYEGFIENYRKRFIYLVRSYCHRREGILDLLDYLDREGFYLELCSKNFHNNFPGGLAKHSLDVHDVFKWKVHQYELNIPTSSVVIASLFHDLCKLNTYKMKDGELVTDDSFPCGHGDKSIIMLQRFIKLTDQEIMLIRWHMGYFESGMPDSYVRKSWRQAIKKYPEIVAFHCADWEAAMYKSDSIGSGVPP